MQLKSIVSRIKEYTVQIKDRVKTHKELNETFLQDVTGNADPNTSDYLEIGDQDGIEVSMIS